MPKFLVVDDDASRRKYIVDMLIRNLNISLDNIDEADNKYHARVKLRQQFYVAVFLDMALPDYKDSDDTNISAGHDILNEIQRGRLKKPTKIIGFTALDDNIPKYEQEFKKLGFDLYLSTPGDFSWLHNLKEQILYTIGSVGDVTHSERKLAILTVHGINTFGDWQEKLVEYHDNSGNSNDRSNLPFKHPGIDPITFCRPKKRNKIIDEFAQDLTFWLERNKAKNIVCFSHSFGTYILIKALEKIHSDLIKPISLVVLSGSVLKEGYDFKTLLDKSNITIVNEVSKDDVPLLFSKAMVLGTGMAGRTGFKRFNGERLIQRFFNGGHSWYFDKDSNFIEDYWIPILDGKDKPKPINICDQYSAKDTILNGTASLSSKIKLIYYALPVLILIALIKNFLI
ncbi:response regulator [Vibrio vulnificus]|uniref:response regulator n=1 Tax=Vibrio vulnificus TaxID=672 RepID=UPI0010289768|nr:response regulator [Vibrio vulnificus]EGQ8022748.1 response regulator [Vibrio vulnificus]RZQ71441.1 response regulator [Vibrio vulnificus]RZQ95886.1 response regulator [Vibrio vulnificus]RZR50283.1 response regulator [Vibrio vulnificus]